MKVCILGNGLTALALAKTLVNMNIYVDLLASKKEHKLSHTRTLGISKTNSDFFNKDIIGIEKLLWKLKRIEIFSENLKKEKLINFENKEDQLFSMIKNYQLYEILKKSLFKDKFFKKKISNNKNLSFIKNYSFIINCDYSHPITTKYFNKKIIKKYSSYAHTTIIKHEKIINNTAIQIFTRIGPLAFLPISNVETSVVYSTHNNLNKKINNIEELICKYNHKFKITKIKHIDSFELKSINLRSYHHGNILAFGDLLHTVHPLAGQGFNMTIRDIRVLASIIKKKKNLGLPLDSSINDEFENIVKHKNFIFTNGIDFIHEFFNMERKIKNKVLSKSAQFFGNNQIINKVLIKFANSGTLF
jgi:2-octaprenyl-6-methoxyphenol hydroxylase